MKSIKIPDDYSEQVAAAVEPDNERRRLAEVKVNSSEVKTDEGMLPCNRHRNNCMNHRLVCLGMKE